MDNNNIKYNKMKNGIYKSNDAVYFVLNEKILMKILGSMYKTTKHFNFGEYQEPLKSGMIEQFDEVYNNVKQW